VQGSRRGSETGSQQPTWVPSHYCAAQLGYKCPSALPPPPVRNVGKPANLKPSQHSCWPGGTPSERKAD